MNKTELIKAIAGKVELSAKDVTAVVDAYADVIADALKAGDKVAVAGFGTYELKKKAERSGFNPIKKEVIVIPASNAPVLKFGKAFKDMFNKRERLGRSFQWKENDAVCASFSFAYGLCGRPTPHAACGNFRDLSEAEAI